MIRILAAALILFATAAAADPIRRADVTVTDGDTIQHRHESIRLIGFDTPEKGHHAKCPAEAALAIKARGRLQRLVNAGRLDLTIVPCACAKGTEGTARCNYGRACGVLTSRGREVGAVLIREKLARPYVCTLRRCPARQSWCG